ncbi:MAG TPA: hypothetical protein VI981_00100, partial [Candidatus Paceibacterota bacterium]
KVRGAYLSMERNLPYLFTYQKYPELNIPNTTNSLDGSFTHLKDKVNRIFITDCAKTGDTK